MEDKVHITKKVAGPILVKGEVMLSWESGEEIPTRPVFSLCGCGRSQNMPFCDGTHKISKNE